MDRNLLKSVALYVGGGIIAGLVIARIVVLAGPLLLWYLCSMFVLLVAFGYNLERSKREASRIAKHCDHRAGSSWSGDRPKSIFSGPFWEE
jgi:hypothetical protein